MHLPPFLLDQWISRYDFADPPIAFNLASSTGPQWTLAQVMALGEGLAPLGDTVLSYSPPEGRLPLRAAIAAFHGVDPDWVVVTTGASEAISILMCLAERPGGEVLFPDPGYPAYAAMAAAWRLRPRTYRLGRAENFVQSAEAVIAAVTDDTAAVIVNTPHNPSGSVMARAETAKLAAKLGERGASLIVDEVYHPIYFGAPQASAADIDNVVVISDLSKALSIPGLRVGWIIDRDPERRARIIDARSYFTISHSPLVEAVAAHAMRNAAALAQRAQALASANLDALEATINASDGLLGLSRPRGGATAFPWFTDGRDCRGFCEDLAARNVLVAPGDCFGRPEHLRIGLAQLSTGFKEGLNILADLAGFDPPHGD